MIVLQKSIKKTDTTYILKVVWSISDEYGPDFSRIVVSDFLISLGEYFEIDAFLDSKKKRVEKEIKKLSLRSAYTVNLIMWKP